LGNNPWTKQLLRKLIAFFDATYEFTEALALASRENGKDGELSETYRELRAMCVKARPISTIMTRMPNSLSRLTIKKGPRHQT
jgi:type II secretory pathway component PulF